MVPRLARCALLCLVLLAPGVAAAAADVDPKILRYFTAEAVARHDAFVRPLYWNRLLDQVLTVGFVAVFLGFQLNRRLKARCEAVTARWAKTLGKSTRLARVGGVLEKMWGDSTWSGALLFTMAYLAIQIALNLPLTFYFGWLYEHQHGTSVESLPRWCWDVCKGLSSEALALSALVFGMYGLARRRANWWLLLGVPSAILMLILGGVFDPIRQQIYYKHERLAEGPTKAAIVRALGKAKVEYDDIYVEKHSDLTRRTDAYIAGEGPTRRIVLWDTVVKAMTPDEAANAVAHEVGHLRDHSPGRLFFASLALVPLLWAVARILRGLGKKGRLGFDSDRDVASLPMIFFLLWLLNMITGPISNAYSRLLERRADTFAFELLEEPEPFRSMMVKLARTNLADVHPPWLWALLASSHPPVMERIEAAEEFARRKGIAMSVPTPESFAIPDALDPLKQAQH